MGPRRHQTMRDLGQPRAAARAAARPADDGEGTVRRRWAANDLGSAVPGLATRRGRARHAAA